MPVSLSQHMAALPAGWRHSAATLGRVFAVAPLLLLLNACVIAPPERHVVVQGGYYPPPPRYAQAVEPPPVMSWKE